MSVLFNAEQQDIKSLFSLEEAYLIPSYQRPYSWEYEQCNQLYNDLIDAFREQEDYFLGNIILAKTSNTNEDKRYQVVDGQQRLISLWLLIKSLNILYPEMKVLSKVLEIESWKGDYKYPRIKSDIFESIDGTEIELIYERNIIEYEERLVIVLNRNKGLVDEKKCSSPIEANSLLFYYWFKEFKNNHSIEKGEEFITFLLKRVSILPILLIGNTISEANNKALTIFETINNRGMNLDDADIFKAKLFEKAKRVNEENKFVLLWKDLKLSCDNLNITVEQLFRYYSHIIRGEAGITTNEIKLRDFFINTPYSPFNSTNDYKQIMDVLFSIVNILEYLNNERNITDEKIAIWLQLVDVYSNLYPKYAIVNYLHVHGFTENVLFEAFLKSLIRYVYFMGSTSTVKFEIYNIIKEIQKNDTIKEYLQEEISIERFSYLGRLKTGYALLAHYLSNLDINVTIPYLFDKIIKNRDENLFSSEEWEDLNLDILGNFIILDIPNRNITLEEKIEYYKKSSIPSVKTLKSPFNINELKERDDELKQLLVVFFKHN